MSQFSTEWVLLRESLSGTVTRFVAAHAAALLAYPGTVWAEVKEEVYEAAEAVANWSAPSLAAVAEPVAAPVTAPVTAPIVPEPIIAPVVEPVAAPIAEPIATLIIAPIAEPVVTAPVVAEAQPTDTEILAFAHSAAGAAFDQTIMHDFPVTPAVVTPII